MVLIYSEQSSPRLEYILNYLFLHLTKFGWSITVNEEEFKNYTGVKLNYSSANLDGVKLVPSGFLFEKGTKPLTPNFNSDSGKQLFFISSAQIDFDPLSALFYFLSRYEEYGSLSYDNHGRFKVDASILKQNNLLEIPLVDIWSNELLDSLSLTFPDFQPERPSYQYLSSIDLDNGYKYKGKSWKRTFGGIIKDLKRFKFEVLAQRVLTVLSLRKDDFDIYQWLLAYHKLKNIPLIFFVPNAKFGTFDRSLPQNSKALAALVRSIKKAGIEVGLHPSYASHKSPSIFNAELRGLVGMAQKEITSSRQHYLKFTLPNTYELLLFNGITNDYSMGFASRSGFRAGTSRSFYFYNLPLEKSTELLVHPASIMEGTFKDYLKIAPDEALHKMKSLVDVVKKTRGNLITVWHEAQLAENSPWRDIYLQLIDYAKA